MKNIACFIVFLFLITQLFSQSTKEFKRIDQWNLEGIFGKEFYSLIDSDNHIVAGFGYTGNRIITPKKIIEFAPRGEGPGDLMHFHAAFHYKGDIAIVEAANKIKIFTKKDNTYVWKATKWVKRGYWIHIIKDGIFFDNKIFLAGQEGLASQKKPVKYPVHTGREGFASLKEPIKYSYLKVYDDSGAPLKQLIVKSFKKPNFFHEVRYHVAGCEPDKVFFVFPYELKLYVVSSKKLEVIKTVELEKPTFYKKMPEHFYAWKKYENMNLYPRDLEEWEMGYSSIQEMLVEGDHLVIQIRTSDEDNKKFALLFYNIETYKLERIELLDDFLLGAKDGKFYCFANGNPGLDEDTDECIINIYSMVKKK